MLVTVEKLIDGMAVISEYDFNALRVNNEPIIITYDGYEMDCRDKKAFKEIKKGSFGIVWKRGYSVAEIEQSTKDFAEATYEEL